MVLAVTWMYVTQQENTVSTNIVAEDGIIYRTEDLQQFQFTFITDSDISNVISQQVERNILKNDSLHFYQKLWRY